MNIGVIGKGVIGRIITFYAAQLNQQQCSGDSATMIDAHKKNLNPVHLLLRPNQPAPEEIRIEPFDATRAKHKTAVSLPFKLITPQLLAQLDLLIMPIKCYQTEALINAIKDDISEHTVLFLLQNGMGGEKIIKQACPNNPLLIGTTTDAGYLNSDKTCIQTASGKMDFGWSEHSKRAASDKIIEYITCLHPNSILRDDIQNALLEKLAINAVINTLCSVYDIKNGELDNRVTEVKALFTEIWPIILACANETSSHPLIKTRLYKRIRQVIKLTANNSCSMREDIKHDRQTEVNGILGYLIAHSGETKIPLTRSYYDQISSSMVLP